MGAKRTGSWVGLAFALAITLALVALDVLWLVDYLDHGAIRVSGRRGSSTHSGGAAIAIIAGLAALALSLLAMVLYFIHRKLKR